ncbi:unnamed protein product [Amaranthus hypochondriacus]
MRGVGGPLLCIGDLLSDVGDAEPQPQIQTPHSPSSLSSSRLNDLQLHFQPSRLSQLFQENYDELNKALSGTDHSWTSLTLKLCTALDTAKKLIDSANSNAIVLTEKVEELQNIIKKGDSAIAEVRSIHSWLSHKVTLPSANET